MMLNKQEMLKVDIGEISIGWRGLGDLTDVDSKEQLADLMDTTYPNKKQEARHTIFLKFGLSKRVCLLVTMLFSVMVLMLISV